MHLNSEKFYWILQVATGICLTILGLLHFTQKHFQCKPPSYEQTLQTFKNPVTLAIGLIFTLTLLYHSLNGIRTILIELGFRNEKIGKIVKVLGILLLSYIILLKCIF